MTWRHTGVRLTRGKVKHLTVSSAEGPTPDSDPTKITAQHPGLSLALVGEKPHVCKKGWLVAGSFKRIALQPNRGNNWWLLVGGPESHRCLKLGNTFDRNRGEHRGKNNTFREAKSRVGEGRPKWGPALKRG